MSTPTDNTSNSSNEPVSTRYYSYSDQSSEDPITFSEFDILAQYWSHWSEQVKYLNAKQEGKYKTPITKDNCIEDWVVINWAWSSTPEEIKKYHQKSKANSNKEGNDKFS